MNWKRIMAIGFVTAATLVVLGVIFIPRAVQRFFYPLAPPMPTLTGKTMTQILAELETAMSNKAPPALEQMQAGLSGEGIAALERQAHVQLPQEIKELYQWHNGCRSRDPLIAGPIPGHRFVPLDETLGLGAVLSNQVAKETVAARAAFAVSAGHTKSWVSLFDDGCGDGYFFDPERKPEQGAVFYCFAEDGQYVFFPSVRNLLAGAVKCYETGAFSWTNGPSGPRLMEDFDRTRTIWQEFGSSNAR